jgi:ribosome-associated protein
MRAIVDAVETTLQKNRSKPLGIEGAKIASWVLIDCDDIIVHIFRQETRGFYNLDGLWADAPRIDFQGSALTNAPTVRKRNLITPAKAR